MNPKTAPNAKPCAAAAPQAPSSQASSSQAPSPQVSFPGNTEAKISLGLIWAQDLNGVIGEYAPGETGKIPWHIPEDLAHFKATTLSYPVIMGRLTWESLGRALPGRRNIVLSSQPGYQLEKAEVYPSLEEALSVLEQDGNAEAWIIGGSRLYAQALAFASKLVVTEVDLQVAKETDQSTPDGTAPSKTGESLSSEKSADKRLVYAPQIEKNLWRKEASQSDSTWRSSRNGLSWRVSTYFRA